MKKLVIVLLFMIIGLPNLFSQMDTGNVWRNAKWGMTEEQVQSAFNGEIIKLNSIDIYGNDSFSSLIIPKVEIQGNEFKVNFLFDNEEKKLHQINLKLIDIKEASVMFVVLEQELIKKYGNPILRDKGEYSWRTTWKTKNSFVALSFLNMPNIISNLIITYSSTTVSDNL